MSGRQRGEDAGFLRVLERQAIRRQKRGGHRIVSPVIIRDQRRAVGIVQLQCRIGQDVVQSKLAERRSKAAQGHSGIVLASAQDKAANHHVVAGLDKATGADLGELRIGTLVVIIHFDEADSGGVVLTGEDGGVSRW